MSEVFFISDTHFSHKNIINFSKTKPFRPFATIEEHDEELIKRWNATVTSKDTVYHLGDFCFGARNIEIASRLNGNKKLVMGNHDMYSSEAYLKYFTKVYGACQYQNLILTHVPVHPCQLEHRFIMNIHGHLHTDNIMIQNIYAKGQMIKDWRYYNVSCEQVNLTPIPFDIILDTWAANN